MMQLSIINFTQELKTSTLLGGADNEARPFKILSWLLHGNNQTQLPPAVTIPSFTQFPAFSCWCKVPNSFHFLTCNILMLLIAFHAIFSLSKVSAHISFNTHISSAHFKKCFDGFVHRVFFLHSNTSQIL